ncbi:MAG TPA: VCBS repeat-containing protein, partial [Clostridia bacterium]|nr:VCBS repeat-containing protein [Clostridia bacterium]
MRIPETTKLNLFPISALLGKIGIGVALVFAPNLFAQISFQLSSSPVVGNNPRSIVAADVNGDGAPDLVTANQNAIANSLTVLTNKGNGEFVGASTLRAESQPYSVVAGDFTGNGTIDLVCANYGASTITAFGGDGLA